MADFTYNNAKDASTDHTSFKLNYGFHPRVFFKNNIDPRSKSYSADKLAKKLKKLIIFANKTYSMPEISRKKHIIKAWSLKAMLKERRFG